MVRIWRRFYLNLSTFGICILVLAAATGLFSTVLGFADALVFHPIRLKEVDRIVRMVGLSAPPPGIDALQWWGQAHSLEYIATYESGLTEVTLSGENRLVNVNTVSPDYFTMLEGRPVKGRLFTADDFRAGSPIAAVISDRLWHERYGGSGSALNAELRVSEIDCVVVGVMPPAFRDPFDSELWVPRSPLTEDLKSAEGGYRGWLGKVASDSSIEAVREQMQALLARLNEIYTPKTRVHYGQLVRVEPLQTWLARSVRLPMFALLAGAGIVLLLSWANVSTLFLSRALERRHEFAIRMSLGATRRRLLVDLSTESAVLGMTSGLLGGVAALWTFELSRPLFEPFLPLLSTESHVPFEIVLFSVLTGCILGFLAGFSPLVLSTLWSDWAVLRQHVSSRGPQRGLRLRVALAVAQMASAMVLLVGAGSAFRTLGHLSQVELGFDPDRVLAMKFSQPPAELEKAAVLIQSLLSEAVESKVAEKAGIISSAPLADRQGFLYLTHGSDGVMAQSSLVQGEYFGAIGIPFLQGRGFAPHDRDAVVVNATLARRFWGDRSPVGELIRVADEPGPREVIGVVSDVRAGRLDQDPEPQFYLPYTYPLHGKAADRMAVTLVAKCASNSAATEQALRKRIEAAGGQIVWARLLKDVFASALAPARLRAMVSGSYAIFGLLLALAGVYGLMRYLAAARMNEMGIRIVLGANSSDIRKLLVGQSAWICVAGIALGALASVPLIHLVRFLLFGVSPADPLIFAVAALVLLFGGMLTTLGPVRHLNRMNLRQVLEE